MIPKYTIRDLVLKYFYLKDYILIYLLNSLAIKRRIISRLKRNINKISILIVKEDFFSDRITQFHIINIDIRKLNRLLLTIR
jgi:hypothetical protein